MAVCLAGGSGLFICFLVISSELETQSYNFSGVIVQKKRTYFRCALEIGWFVLGMKTKRA